jgi:hypothetical protein
MYAAMVAAPPSTHENGRIYAWDVNYAPDKTAIAAAPAWLLAWSLLPVSANAQAELPENCERPLGGELLCQMLSQLICRLRVFGTLTNADTPEDKPARFPNFACRQSRIRQRAHSQCDVDTFLDEVDVSIIEYDVDVQRRVLFEKGRQVGHDMETSERDGRAESKPAAQVAGTVCRDGCQHDHVGHLVGADRRRSRVRALRLAMRIRRRRRSDGRGRW